MNACVTCFKKELISLIIYIFIIKFLFNFKCIHAIAWSYVLVYINSPSSKKIQLDFNWTLNFAPRVPFNLDFVPSELLSVKSEEFKSN